MFQLSSTGIASVVRFPAVLIVILLIGASAPLSWAADYGPTNHAGGNLTLTNGDRIWGAHTNVGTFTIPVGAIVTVREFETAAAGSGLVEVEAADIVINGTLDASGAGHEGGGGGGGGGGSALGGPFFAGEGGHAGAPGSVLRDGSAGSYGNAGTADYYDDWGGTGGAGGAGAGTYSGSGGAATAGVAASTGPDGQAGTAGAYSVPVDSTTDLSVWMGSGGGAGGGAAGGGTNSQNVSQGAGGGGGGGAGGAGGGCIMLTASNSMDLDGGTLLSPGTQGGDGAGGWSGIASVTGGQGGNGGGGGSTTPAAEGLGGNPGPGQGGQNIPGGRGGAGGSGGGGGILINCALMGGLSMEGATINVGATASDGTVKVRYGGFDPTGGATITAGRVDAQNLGGGVRYVKVGGVTTGEGNSWANAWTIEKAASSALADEHIVVAAGVYSLTTDLVLGEAGQTWLGGFPATGDPGLDDRDPAAYPTILDGNDTVRSGFDIAENSVGITIDGFTMRNGVTSANGQGGAVTVKGAGNLSIIDCVIESNSGSFGALLIREPLVGSQMTTATLERCVFRQNESSVIGGAISIGSLAVTAVPVSVTISECTFTSNTASFAGAAVALHWRGPSSVEISRCSFVGNSTAPPFGFAGTALYANPEDGDNQLQVTNCVFHGNVTSSASWGAVLGIGWGHQLEMVNCTASGNYDLLANPSSSMIVYFGSGMGPVPAGRLANNIFETNGNGVGVGPDAAMPTIENNLFFGNTAVLYVNMSSAYVLDVAGLNALGTASANLYGDPLFVSGGATPDLHLQLSSPAIDTGTAIGAPLVDFDGLTRPVDFPGIGSDGSGQGFDIGAYEAAEQPRTSARLWNMLE
ncbi:right-handed parallel beta-helix repeat-containing protein [Candidatus Sumerlaeota bacterium]